MNRLVRNLFMVVKMGLEVRRSVLKKKIIGLKYSHNHQRISVGKAAQSGYFK